MTTAPKKLNSFVLSSRSGVLAMIVSYGIGWMWLLVMPSHAGIHLHIVPRIFFLAYFVVILDLMLRSSESVVALAARSDAEALGNPDSTEADVEGGRAGGGLPRWLSEWSRTTIVLAAAFVVLLAFTFGGYALRQNAASKRREGYNEAFARAGTLLSQLKNDEAAQAYREALAMQPDNPMAADAYNNLGWALQQQDKLDEAIEAYASALKIKPTFQLAANNLAAVRSARERKTKPLRPGSN